MQISMDKYKTSIMGQALKKVYRGAMSVDESVMLAKNEIAEVFDHKEAPIELDTNTGFYGDLVGKCPICGKNVVKGKYGYGCLGYKEGCKFRIGSFICKRSISLSNARLLLESGKTSEIQGFISKAGKPFNARLKLDGDKVVFDF